MRQGAFELCCATIGIADESVIYNNAISYDGRVFIAAATCI